MERGPVYGHAVHSNKMHTKWADRPFWRYNPRRLCSMDSKKGIAFYNAFLSLWIDAVLSSAL